MDNSNLSREELLLQIVQLQARVAELEVNNSNTHSNDFNKNNQSENERNQLDALRISEEKYRTLFNSIDEGFCTIEVLFDEQDKAYDYRFLETNPAFLRQTGLESVVGKTVRSLVPFHEEFWYEVYGQIAKTGQAQRFEHQANALNRFYDVYAFPIGEPQQNRVAVIFNDIFLRKQAEEDLRETEDKYRTQLEKEVRERTFELKESRDLLKATTDSSMEMIQVFEAVRNATGEIVDFKWVLNNHTSEIMYGDVIGKSLLENNPGVIEEGIFDIFKRVVETGEPNQAEHHYVHEQFDGWFYQSAVKLNDGVATTTTDITERKVAELEVLRLKDEMAQQATDKYQALFNSIDEGFHITELIFDEKGQAVDYRFLEVNPVFERQTGLKNVVGKLGSELVSHTETYWLDNYSRVVRTGEPIRFENYNEATDRWYSAYTSRVGGPESRQVAIVFDDITERKINEQRQEFLLKMSDTLRPLTDPARIQGEACKLLGEQLQVDRAYYAEINVPEGWARVAQDYIRTEVASLVGTYPVTYFDWMLPPLLQGEILNFTNRDGLDSISELERAALEAGQMEAVVAVPLIKTDGLKGVLAVTEARPHQWKTYEIKLIEETAERIWDTIERARIEKALRESEQNLQGVTNIVPDLLWYSAPDGAIIWYNKRWLEYTGQSFEEAAGWGWVRTIHPVEREMVTRRYREAIEKGTQLDLEYRIKNSKNEYRWFLVRFEPYRNEQVQLVRMYGAATDIHEQRLNLEDLEKRVKERTDDLATSNTKLAEVNSQLQRERERLHMLSLRLLDVQETERRFLAKELHDEIGQYLTGLKFQLEINKRLLDGKSDKGQQFANTIETVDALTTRVRELSLNLRPTILDDLGLLPALVTLFERFSNQTRIAVKFFQQGLDQRFVQTIETTVYRVTQEALTNSARYAKVETVMVNIMVEENIIILFIQDEGTGFDLEEVILKHNSTGISAMRERVDLVEGKFNIESEPGRGTTIIAELPLRPKTAAARGKGISWSVTD